MAASPSHKFGQIIGEILEETMIKYFQAFANEKKLYLDTKGIRKARKGKKVSWIDSYGNKHDLDFVLERHGSETKIGTPVAFIESAWRRYTKHSRNKAQEIQGAVLPLALTHSFSAPFLGVVLAGVFTKGAINQLTSRGFSVLYLEYKTLIEAFDFFGLDAFFDEKTTTQEFNSKIEKWYQSNSKDKVIDKLIELNQDKVDVFFASLSKSVSRYVTEIRIHPLYGTLKSLPTIKDALKFLNDTEFIVSENDLLVKFEIKIVYSNGDKIDAQFSDKENAKKFLMSYDNPPLKIQDTLF